ncbi:MAG: hypothetical protein QGG40_03825 [Myxococcota bacterium]|nr:hypothetical protein [Myxococcota bacterium]
MSSPLTAAAETEVGGYFRVMTRPDFQGGNGALGYWNLYGRLLNEGPYAAVEMKVDLLEPHPTSHAAWTRVHARIEGDSIGNADPDDGQLSELRLSQVYALAGNVGLQNVTWRMGTLETYFGDLGLYDMRPTTLFEDTVGASGRWQTERLEVQLGMGDAGYAIRGSEYNTIFTGGGTLRWRPLNRLEFGLGGQARHEPRVDDNRYAPHTTPGTTYEDFVRQEVVESWLAEHPDDTEDFPDPVATDGQSWKAVGYLGFGDLGPLSWTNLFAAMSRLHPDSFYEESLEDDAVTIFVTDLTDERYQLTLGGEAQFTVAPWLDGVLSGLYGSHWDLDNQIVPTDHDRQYTSTVLRLQAYLRPTVHLLLESSMAREFSRNGNAYREHRDSIFANTDGTPDTEGLQYGDTDTRNTWQGKGGLVLNPMGPGVFTRPSLRLLYGTQHSNQNNAFGNSFIETLDQHGDFDAVERHWHHLISLETEVWF